MPMSIHALRVACVLVSLSMLSFFFNGQAVADPQSWKRAGFSTDFSKATVSFDSIFSGGPPKDGIPSIDNPAFVPAHSVDWLDNGEPVIRLEVNGEVKAYPLQILIWHEIVNDTIADTPVSVTYCPLCNSSIAFDRRLDGQKLDFGTTGLLRNSDLVMYDRQTETWWQQFTGEGIVGAHSGRELKMLPSRVMAFSDFKEDHPAAPVLARPEPPIRDYGRNPYVSYDSRSSPYPLFQGSLPEDINPMARVVVIKNAEKRVAVTLDHVRQKKEVRLTDTIVVRWTGEQSSILDRSLTKDGKSIATVEAVWTLNGTETALVHDLTFAFVVHAFHPELSILGIKEQ